MNPTEFSNLIRNKYPGAYDSVDDVELSKKWIEKFPVYSSKVKFDDPAQSIDKTFGEKMEDRAVGGVKGAIEQTTDTAKLLQDFGNRLISLSPGITYEEAKENLGFPSLKEEQYSKIKELLKSQSQEEKQGKIIEFVAELFWPVGKATEVAGAVQKGKQVAGELLETGKNKAEGAIREGVETLKEAPGKIKEKITGVKKLTGSAKITDDSVNIARERFSKEYEEAAAMQGRMKTHGSTKQVMLEPTRREQLLGDAIRPLVEQGRISADNLPFENIPEIQLEVNRINQGVGEMLADRKMFAGPFNSNQLRTKLAAVKKDADIIFTTDPTLERTYDALIDAFMKEVGKKDVQGLFEARQNFDKLPAVKKLLDGLKGAQGENLRRQAVLDIRRAANEYVADLLPKNNPYRNALKQESYMIEVMGNLAEKSKGLTGTTNYQRFLDESPVLKTIIRTAIPFGAGGAVF